MSVNRVMTVVFLDVGQGDATIILPPEGEGDPIVFDCGPDGWVVTQQLKTWRIERLHAVIASHLDLDHVGGMATLLSAYSGRINLVYFPMDRDISKDQDGAVNVKKLADQVRAPAKEWEVRIVHGDSRPVASGTDWWVDVVAPPAQRQLDAQRHGAWKGGNFYSAVVRAHMAGTTVLIGSDAPLMTWSEMMIPRAAEVFRVPHHGGAIDDGGVPDGWSPERLYDEVDPNLAVISVGTNNRYDHPDESWIGPLIGGTRCRLLCTQVTGRCHPDFDRAAPENRRRSAIRQARSRLPSPHEDNNHFAEPPWRHYKQPRDRDRTRGVNFDLLEVPCAGTISVRIDAGGKVDVDPSDSHPSLAKRIRRWSAPLCRRRPD